jgi:protease PrsW
LNPIFKQLSHKTRSRSFLWKVSAGIITTGLLLGGLVSFVDFESDLSLRNRIDSLFSTNVEEFADVGDIRSGMASDVLSFVHEAFEAGRLDTETLLQEIPYLQFWIKGAFKPQFEILFTQYLSPQDLEITLLFLKFLGSSSDEAEAKLQKLADSDPPRRYANQVLGMVASKAERYDKAFAYLIKESEFPEAQYAREQAVINRGYVKDYATLGGLAGDPRFKTAFSPWIHAEIAVTDQNWLGAVKWIFLSQLDRIEPGSFILATIAMVIWAVILMQLCQFWRFDNWTPILCITGIALGALSTTPTLLWILLEDHFLPISEGAELFHSIVYYIATVGLREEVCKLLLFLPLVPVLVKRGNELEFLLVASCVGLGFAYEENFGYLSSSMGTGSIARFLTANFLHISLTGMCGLFFCRMWKTQGYSYNDFLFIFGIAIIAHGLYDALLTHPPMNDQGFTAMILYIVFSKYYFKESHGLRVTASTIVSISATMAFGISLLIASLIVYLSALLSLPQAIQLAFGGFLGTAIILFMFFREFNETLID